MSVDNEDINNRAATPASPANSVPSTADDWWNANTIVDPEPCLPLPDIGQQELRWSTQVLAQLPAVPGYDGDAVFRTKQRTTPRHGKTSALRHGQPHVKKHGQILVSGL